MLYAIEKTLLSNDFSSTLLVPRASRWSGKSGKRQLPSEPCPKIGLIKLFSVQNAMTPPQLSQYFRSFLIRLSLLDGYLGLISPECDPTFAIVLEMKDDTQPMEPIGKVRGGFQWYITDSDYTTRKWVRNQLHGFPHYSRTQRRELQTMLKTIL